MSLVCTQQNEESSYYTIVRWTTKTFTQSSVTLVALGNKIAKRKGKSCKREKCNCTWTGRRALALTRPRLDADSDDRPWNRVRESGSLWWLDRRHQRGGVSNVNTVDDVQRQASQRRNSSGPYGKKRRVTSRRRYVQDVCPTTPLSVALDSSTPVDGSTTARPFSYFDWHPELSGNTHGQQNVSSSGSETRPSHSVGLNAPTTSTSTVATVVHHRNSSATRAQFQSHCNSVIHISRLTELLCRSLNYIYIQWLHSVNSHLILTRRQLAHTGIGAPARALQSQDY